MPETLKNPYVGAKSFTENEQKYFFGRDQESSQLASQLIAYQEVLFYAESGAGKTSLLQAKVIPYLRSSKIEIVVLPKVRVGGDLPPGVDPQEVSNFYIFNLLYSLGGKDTDPKTLVDRPLDEGLRPYLFQDDDEDQPHPFLLIIDQFEELFTNYPAEHKQREALFIQLRKCLRNFPQLGILLVRLEPR